MSADVIDLRNCERCGELFNPELRDGSELYCPECDPKNVVQKHFIDREE